MEQEDVKKNLPTIKEIDEGLERILVWSSNPDKLPFPRISEITEEFPEGIEEYIEELYDTIDRTIYGYELRISESKRLQEYNKDEILDAGKKCYEELNKRGVELRKAIRWKFNRGPLPPTTPNQLP